MSPEDLTRYWSRIDIRSDDECWEWTKGRATRGYGAISIRGKQQGAHRVGLSLKLGRPLKPGEQALHTCDNPPCCNPSHLFPGTHADNMADKAEKGRSYNGEQVNYPRTPAEKSEFSAFMEAQTQKANARRSTA